MDPKRDHNIDNHPFKFKPSYLRPRRMYEEKEDAQSFGPRIQQLAERITGISDSKCMLPQFPCMNSLWQNYQQASSSSRSDGSSAAAEAAPPIVSVIVPFLVNQFYDWDPILHIWVVVKIRVPFLVLNIIRHLLFRVHRKGP